MFVKVDKKEQGRVSDQDEYTVREESLLDHLHLPVNSSAELCEYGLSHGGGLHAILSHPQLRVFRAYSDVYYSVERNFTKLRGGGGYPLVE